MLQHFPEYDQFELLVRCQNPICQIGRQEVADDLEPSIAGPLRRDRIRFNAKATSRAARPKQVEKTSIIDADFTYRLRSSAGADPVDLVGFVRFCFP